VPADFMFLFDFRHTRLARHYLCVLGGLMKRIQRITVLATTLVLPISCFAQTGAEKKSYTFHGQVQVVDESAKSLKVNGEEVKGWMAAMTMDYRVDDATVLKKVKPGDHIKATVYDGDLVLHNVQVVPKPGSESKSKASH
jgi:Cu/Ag efflux protein CusF